MIIDDTQKEIKKGNPHIKLFSLLKSELFIENNLF